MKIRDIIVEMSTNGGDSTILYHVTSTDNVEKIKNDGFKPVSYWGNAKVSEYYYETIREETGGAVIFSVNLNDLDPTLIEPDYPGIEEPITSAVGISEEEVHDRWMRSSKTVQDSLNIVGSIRYRGVITKFTIEDEW